MNIKLVESLAQVVPSLSPEVRSLLEDKLKTHQEQTSWAKAFREWAESHPRDRPSLSDEAISRESIDGERG